MGLTTRRKFLFGSLGIIGIGGVTAWLQKNAFLRWMVLRTRNDGIKLTVAPNLTEDVCTLTSSQVEGPFFIASPIRSDIKEDRKGKELTLKMQLVRMPECRPVVGAVVEMWHCDAEGNYSGYPGDLAHNLWGTLRFLGASGEHIKPVNEARFLRGAQVSDVSGQVEFNTIFPGWYEPEPRIFTSRLSLTSRSNSPANSTLSRNSAAGFISLRSRMISTETVSIYRKTTWSSANRLRLRDYY